jgi:hypothetical protein
MCPLPRFRNYDTDSHNNPDADAYAMADADSYRSSFTKLPADGNSDAYRHTTQDPKVYQTP